jgi:triosephosphate isomerase
MMYPGLRIEPPFFEIGPKAYLYGKALLKLAQHADKLSCQYNVRIIITPQCVDIAMLARETEHILVFAQHIDFLRPGRGIGSLLPEAIKEVGAVGTLLNHVEKKLKKADIERTIQRADEVGLATMVCADNAKEAVEIARMGPNIILVEAPNLIETGKREINDRSKIKRDNQMIREINPNILVLHGGGISGADDVYNIVKCGAQGTGSTSGVILAKDPFKMLEEMISAMRKAWDEIHSIGE